MTAAEGSQAGRRAREKTQVLISGGGPVGSFAALALARAGIDVVLCEKRGHRAQDLRASTFHPPTLEMLDAVGVIQPILDYGLKAPVYHFRERRTGETIPFDFSELDDVTKYPFRIQCEQHVMADFVTEELHKLPNVQVLYDHGVVSFEQKADKVAIDVEAPLELRRFEADYFIAAEGGNSLTRKRLDVEFEGFTYPEKFVCLSTEVELREHFENLALVNYVADESEWLVLLRAPSAWRCLAPVLDSTPDSELLSDAFKEAFFERLIGRPDTRTLHRTVYRVHQRVATRFNFGRVFLVGDAAHLNNPLGGFGMNSGIHDAWNVQQRIQACLQHGHDPESFEQFDRQRRSVTHSFIQAQTMQNKRFLEYNKDDRHDERLREMRETCADDTLRRNYLLRQSMLQSVAEERKVA